MGRNNLGRNEKELNQIKQYPGFIYLIHFEKPFKRAKHYMGWTDNIPKRLARHKAGHGSRLLRAVNMAGIDYHIVRIWEGDRNFERKLKKRKESPNLCPVCNKNFETNSSGKALWDCVNGYI